MSTEPPGNDKRSRAGVQGLALALQLLENPPLRECLAALAEKPGTPPELVGRLGLDEDVVLECCRTLDEWGLAEKDGASA
jgi:hypothetical protein